MYRILRIISCIIAVAGAAAAILVFIWVPNIVWGIIVVAVAVVFALLMFLFRRLERKQEEKKNPPPPEGDFITGRVERNDEDDNIDF